MGHLQYNIFLPTRPSQEYLVITTYFFMLVSWKMDFKSIDAWKHTAF